MEGVPRITTPSKSSRLVSLFAVATTTAHNSVLPSVPAKAIFFIQQILSTSDYSQMLRPPYQTAVCQVKSNSCFQKPGSLNLPVGCGHYRILSLEKMAVVD
jgi:hypothetical protein